MFPVIPRSGERRSGSPNAYCRVWEPHPDRHSGGNWVCLYNWPLCPAGRGSEIGFVLPRPVNCAMYHKSFPAKHLSVLLVRRELGLFVQHPSARAPPGPAWNWVRFPKRGIEAMSRDWPLRPPPPGPGAASVARNWLRFAQRIPAETQVCRHARLRTPGPNWVRFAQSASDWNGGTIA